MRVGETDPDFTVHEKPMVEVDDALLEGIRASIDPQVFLSLLPC